MGGAHFCQLLSLNLGLHAGLRVRSPHRSDVGTSEGEGIACHRVRVLRGMLLPVASLGTSLINPCLNLAQHRATTTKAVDARALLCPHLNVQDSVLQMVEQSMVNPKECDLCIDWRTHTHTHTQRERVSRDGTVVRGCGATRQLAKRTGAASATDAHTHLRPIVKLRVGGTLDQRRLSRVAIEVELAEDAVSKLWLKATARMDGDDQIHPCSQQVRRILCRQAARGARAHDAHGCG
jgi:hypothetical protein